MSSPASRKRIRNEDNVGSDKKLKETAQGNGQPIQSPSSTALIAANDAAVAGSSRAAASTSSSIPVATLAALETENHNHLEGNPPSIQSLRTKRFVESAVAEATSQSAVRRMRSSAGSSTDGRGTPKATSTSRKTGTRRKKSTGTLIMSGILVVILVVMFCITTIAMGFYLVERLEHHLDVFAVTAQLRVLETKILTMEGDYQQKEDYWRQEAKNIERTMVGFQDECLAALTLLESGLVEREQQLV